MKTARLLVVDDTPENIDILVTLLTDYDIAVALDGESALDAATAKPFDLILLDIMMPGIDGLSLCRRLKAGETTRDIPIIFVTAKTDENSIEAAYGAGGDDYVTKPFRPREVLARVKLLLERASYLKQLEFLSSYDPMTGLYNRRKFFELGHACFTRSDTAVVVGAIMDIDHFKAVNDTYGHPAGDEVIRRVAATLATALPPSVILGRIGGEEFAVVGGFGNIQEATALLEQCRQAVEILEIPYGDDTIHCTLSCGSACKGMKLDTLDTLLNEADHALYEAKGGGRNRHIVRT